MCQPGSIPIGKQRNERITYRHVTGDTTREAKLFEEFPHTFFVHGNIGVIIGVGTLKVNLRYNSRSTVSGSTDVNHVQLAFFDKAVEMNIDEILSTGRTKMTQQARLDIGNSQGSL